MTFYSQSVQILKKQRGNPTSSCSFLRKFISSWSDSTFLSRSSLARAALSTSCRVTIPLGSADTWRWLKLCVPCSLTLHDACWPGRLVRRPRTQNPLLCSLARSRPHASSQRQWKTHDGGEGKIKKKDVYLVVCTRPLQHRQITNLGSSHRTEARDFHMKNTMSYFKYPKVYKFLLVILNLYDLLLLR